MKNMMKKISVLLSAIAILAWGGVTVGCSDGSDDGDYDPKALEGLWIDSEDDANAVYFKDGKAYFDVQKGEDGTYSSADDGAPYSVKGDVITAGDTTVKIIDMRVKDYVKLAMGDETATYKYSDKKFSSGNASGGDGEDDSKYYAKEYSAKFSASDEKKSFSIEVKSDKVAKVISFEYKTDTADGVDISTVVKVGDDWDYVKIPDAEDAFPKLTTEWKTFTTPALAASGSEISGGKASAENSGWYVNGETKNGILQVVGMELYNGSAKKDGTVYIKNLKVLDQDGNPIDLSDCEWKDD